MATATKTATDPAERAKRALKITRTAAAKASKIQIDEELNVSTRTRRALKVRSDALDDIERALTGKDA